MSELESVSDRREKSTAKQSRQVTAGTDGSRKKLAKIVAEGLTTGEAAQLLSSSSPAIAREVRRRHLYGVSTSTGWRLPKFQFRRQRLVRNIDRVLTSLDPRLHPLEVVNWFTIENADLVIDGASVTPIEWLESGRDAQKVAKLATGVAGGL